MHTSTAFPSSVIRTLLRVSFIVAVSVPVQAQSGSPTKAGTLTFEVASVKRSELSDAAGSMGMTPTGVTFINLSLFEFLQNAFGLEDFQISGGPNWIKSDRFDIIAKATDGTAWTRTQLNEMLQNLLVERFRLVIRRETKPLPIYALRVVTRGRFGEQLRPNNVDCTSRDTPITVRRDPAQCELRYGYETIDARGRPLIYLTGSLASHVGRQIVDETGLTGAFDFSIRWNRSGKVDSPNPSLFTALQEQLGLRLEATTGPVETLTIVSAERPTPN